MQYDPLQELQSEEYHLSADGCSAGLGLLEEVVQISCVLPSYSPIILAQRGRWHRQSLVHTGIKAPSCKKFDPQQNALVVARNGTSVVLQFHGFTPDRSRF